MGGACVCVCVGDCESFRKCVTKSVRPLERIERLKLRWESKAPFRKFYTQNFTFLTCSAFRVWDTGHWQSLGLIEHFNVWMLFYLLQNMPIQSYWIVVNFIVNSICIILKHKSIWKSGRNFNVCRWCFVCC